MKDQNKTKKELINELNGLRQRVDELETLNKERKCVEVAIRENEEMFRALAETVTSGIAVFQGEKFCYVNPAVTIITGYTQEELLVMHFWDFVHPDFKELVRKRGLARQRGEALTSRYEVKIVNKCGEIRWIDVAATFIKFKGVPAGLVALLDITERKRAEEKVLRQSAVLDAINKVLLETLTCETDEEVACTCLSVAEALTGSKFGFIGEVNQRGRFDTIALSDPGWDSCKMPKSNAALITKGMEIRGFWGKVIKNGESLIVNDPASHPESVGIPEGHPQLNSFLGVPLKHEGKAFGMIALANRASGYGLADQKDVETLSVAFVEALKRKRSEESLRKSEVRYRALIESQIDLISRYQPDTTLTFVNDAYCQFYGKTREELIGHSYLSMVAPEFHELVLKETENMVKDPRPIAGEYLNYRKDGEECWIQWVVQGIVDENGRVVELQASGRDITRLKQTEQNLRQSEEDYRDLYENAPNGYFSVNAEGQVGRCNRYLVEMLGYKSADEIVGMPVEGLYADTPYGKSKIQQVFQDVRAGGSVHDEELQMQKRDGAPLWTSLTTNAERDDEGQFRWTRSMVVNITERKRMEDLLKIERDLGLVLSATSGLNETLSLCFDVAIRVSGMDCGGIYLIDETSGDLDLVFHKGLSADFVESVSHYNADSVNARLVMEGKPIYSHHQELGVPLSENEHREGLHAIAVIPVQFEDRVIACLNISSHTLDEVPDFTRTALETIATQIGNAIIRTKAEETLRESEVNYRELANSISDVFFGMDKDLKYTYWNKASENLLGIPAKDAIGKSLYEFFPQIRGTRVEEVYLEVLKTQQAQSFINKFRIGDKNFIFDISAYPSYRGLSVFVKDITEQKRMEDTLRQSEELFSKIFYTSPVPISLTILSNGRFLNVNDSFLHLMGYHREEVIGHTAIELQWWADPEDRKRLLEMLRKHGTVKGWNVKLRSKSGEIRETLASIELIEMAGEQILLGLVQDITEQKRTEEALWESKANLYALIGNTNDWICSVDSGYKILTINRAWRNMFFFVYKIELEEGMNLMECFPPERRSFWEGIHSRALRDQHFTFEDHYDPEGISIDVDVSVNPIVGENGEITGVSYFIRDITEQKQVERTLRESQELYRSLFEGVPVGLYRTMPSGEILDANQAFVKMLGYLDPASLLVTNLINMYAILDERKRWESLMEKEGIVRDFEARFRRKDDTVIWICDTCRAVRNDDGQVLYYEGAIQDITERKRAEEALRESEERYRTLFEESRDVIYITTREGKFIDINKSGLELFAYNKEEIMSLNVQDIYVDPDDRLKFQQEIECEGFVRDYEIKFRKKDGTAIDGLVTAIVQRANDGTILGYQGIIRDITERKRAEEELRKSQQLLAKTFSSLHEAVFIINANTVEIMDCNPAASEIFGYSREEMLGRKTAFLHIDKAALKEFRRHLYSGLEEKGFLSHFEFRMKRKNGTIFPTEHHVMPLEDEQERHVGWVSVVHDITERKQAEDQLRSSREQLRALSAHLQSVREEERALIAREIHDELGQELTGLKMDLSWLIKRLPGDQELLLNKTESMLKLVDNTIQSVRRISTKLRPGVLDDLGLTAAIEWQAQDFQIRTGIECAFHSNLREVDLDRDRSTTVFRILQETLTNVARHASATHVSIFLNEEATSLVLVVEDNGRGITESEASDPKSLGLLGMRERALVFGGEVEIRGLPGRGTTVTLKIPLQK